MGEKPDIRELIQSHPQLGSSLQQLLDYPGDDVEDVFMLDFMVSTTGMKLNFSLIGYYLLPSKPARLITNTWYPSLAGGQRGVFDTNTSTLLYRLLSR